MHHHVSNEPDRHWLPRVLFGVVGVFVAALYVGFLFQFAESNQVDRTLVFVGGTLGPALVLLIGTLVAVRFIKPSSR